THVLHGNNKALQTPRRMSPTHDPRDLAVWNLRAFREAFDGFLTNAYHPVEHPALGISPAKAMELSMQQTGARSHTLIAYDRNFVIATLPAGTKDTAKIQRDGSFKANRIDYFSAALVVYAGQQLEVKYDPFDFSRAYAMGKSGWIEAISMHAGFLAGRTEKEIEAISQEIDQINKRDGIREKDRARALGAYLRSVRSRETVLAIEVQQARDRELRAADADVGLLGVPSDGRDNGSDNVLDFAKPAQDKVAQRAAPDDVFENIAEQTFEDF
ncbi:MAG: Mu transposase C-terminal domain-containing protein, partial [Burkholderiaceae bacterium]|nr:Mu transposase C-terminal domain-containing protein [Burkholderiaceae bacterium]